MAAVDRNPTMVKPPADERKDVLMGPAGKYVLM